MKDKNTPANNWFESLKDEPEKIIEWAKAEIREYKKLIRLIEKSMKENEKK